MVTITCGHLQHGKCVDCKRRENFETLKGINDRHTKRVDDYTEAREILDDLAVETMDFDHDSRYRAARKVIDDQYIAAIAAETRKTRAAFERHKW